MNAKTLKLKRNGMTLSIGKSPGSNDLLPIHVYDGSEGHQFEATKEEARQIVEHLKRVFALDKTA